MRANEEEAVFPTKLRAERVEICVDKRLNYWAVQHDVFDIFRWWICDIVFLTKTAGQVNPAPVPALLIHFHFPPHKA